MSESKTSESKTSSPILSHKSTGSSDDETENEFNEFRLIDFEGEEDEEEVRN